MPSLSQRLTEFANAVEGRSQMNLGEAALILGPKGPALLALFFSLPFVFFIPMPGLSVILGAVILLNGWRIARQRPLWLPRFLLVKPISSAKLSHNLRRPVHFLKKVEKWIRPRGVIFQNHPAFEALNGWVLAASGFFLLLPLPPGTNFLPGLAVFFLSLGILEQDLALIILGYAAALLNVVLLSLIPWLILR